jgi:carbonic anhydrase
MRRRQAHCILFSMNLSRRALIMLGAAAPSVLRSQNSPAGRISADEALKALMDGNERFRKGETITPRRSPADFSSMALHQAPEAIIIACADSRVPPEILFDQGVGDLFVIRVAGNIVNRAEAGVVGSMAFAVLILGAPLVMVLGHSNCGAVEAALGGKKDSLPPSIRDLVTMVQTGSEKDLAQAIAANVKAGVVNAKVIEPAFHHLIQKGRLKVVGAVYDLASGRVSLVG